MTKLGLIIVNPAKLEPQLKDWGRMRQFFLCAQLEAAEKRRSVQFPGGEEEGPRLQLLEEAGA